MALTVFLVYCLLAFWIGQHSFSALAWFLGAEHAHLQDAVSAVSLAYSVLGFYLWYYFDARQLNHDRTLPMTLLVVFVPFLGLLVYFLKTRNPLQALASSALFALALMVVIYIENLGTQMAPATGRKPAATVAPLSIQLPHKPAAVVQGRSSMA